jgi:hypothetical protein
MKNSTIIIKIAMFCTCLFLLGIKTQAGNEEKYDTLSVLQVEGKINNLQRNPNEECIVELISNNETIDTIVLKEGKKEFQFTLDRNTSYYIRISKKGYVSVLISVNTQLPDDDRNFGLYSFAFETDLVKDKSMRKLKKDVPQLPVAIISFDSKSSSFSNDKAYPTDIKELYWPAEGRVLSSMEEKVAAVKSH